MQASPVKDILPHLLCPVSQSPNANTMLVPCLHKVCRSAAEKLYQPDPNGSPKGKCLVCRRDVSGIKTVPSIQKLLEFFFSPFSQQAKDVLDAFICPSTNQPLKDAFALIPCGHHVNKAALPSKKSDHPSPLHCPSCQMEVADYAQDRTIQVIAQELYRTTAPLQTLHSWQEDPRLNETRTEMRKWVDAAELRHLFADSSSLELSDREVLLYFPPDRRMLNLFISLVVNEHRPATTNVIREYAVKVLNAALEPLDKRITLIASDGEVVQNLNHAFISFSFALGGKIHADYRSKTIAWQLLVQKMMHDSIDVIILRPGQKLFFSDYSKVANADAFFAWFGHLLPSGCSAELISPGKLFLDLHSGAVAGDQGVRIELKRPDRESRPLKQATLQNWPLHALRKPNAWVFEKDEFAQFCTANRSIILPAGTDLTVFTDCSLAQDQNLFQFDLLCHWLNSALKPAGLMVDSMNCKGGCSVIRSQDFLTIKATEPFDLHIRAMDICCPIQNFASKLLSCQFQQFELEPNQRLFLTGSTHEQLDELFTLTKSEILPRVSALVPVPSGYTLNISSLSYEIKRGQTPLALVLSSPQGIDFRFDPLTIEERMQH